MHARVTRSVLHQATSSKPCASWRRRSSRRRKSSRGSRGTCTFARGAVEGAGITLWATAEDMRAGETDPYYRAQSDKVCSLLATEPDVGGFEVVVHELGN